MHEVSVSFDLSSSSPSSSSSHSSSTSRSSCYPSTSSTSSSNTLYSATRRLCLRTNPSPTHHKWLYHLDACAGSVLTPHDHVANVQKRLGNPNLGGRWPVPMAAVSSWTHSWKTQKPAATPKPRGALRVCPCCRLWHEIGRPWHYHGTQGLTASQSRPADILTTTAVPRRSAALDVCAASSTAAAARGDAAQVAFDRELSHHIVDIGELRQQGIHCRPLVWSADGRPHPAVTRTLPYAADIASSRNGQHLPAESLHRRRKHEIQITLLRLRAAVARAVLPNPSARAEWLFAGIIDRALWQESERALNKGSRWSTVPHTRFANRNAIPQQPMFFVACCTSLLCAQVAYAIFTRRDIQHTPQHYTQHNNTVQHNPHTHAPHFLSSSDCVRDSSMINCWWLVGDKSGERAETAAILRMVAGAHIAQSWQREVVTRNYNTRHPCVTQRDSVYHVAGGWWAVGCWVGGWWVGWVGGLCVWFVVCGRCVGGWRPRRWWWSSWCGRGTWRMSLSIHVSWCTWLGWQNARESDSRRPHHREPQRPNGRRPKKCCKTALEHPIDERVWGTSWQSRDCRCEITATSTTAKVLHLRYFQTVFCTIWATPSLSMHCKYHTSNDVFSRCKKCAQNGYREKWWWIDTAVENPELSMAWWQSMTRTPMTTSMAWWQSMTRTPMTTSMIAWHCTMRTPTTTWSARTVSFFLLSTVSHHLHTHRGSSVESFTSSTWSWSSERFSSTWLSLSISCTSSRPLSSSSSSWSSW